MALTAIRSPKLPAPVGPFSPAVAAGDFIFVSGQVGQDPATGRLVEGGVTEEARQIFANIGALLDAAGVSFQNVVRVGVFLADMQDFNTVNAEYAQHFTEPFPARTTVTVAALPLDASIEVELTVKP